MTSGADDTLKSDPSARGDRGAALEDARYEERGELGRGGIGRVVLAYDRLTEREVALKALLGGRASEAAKARFFREAKLTARLEHPGVVPVYELRAGEQGFYTMKVIRGATLAAKLEAAKTPSERLALLPAFASVCQTLAYAHAKGVIHRDLKPSNVMIGAFGEVLVVDWGLARERGQAELPASERRPSSAPDALTRDGAVLGTPAYMSPEQASGRTAELDARADVWSLGVILFELLTGRLPLLGRDAAETLAKVIAEPVPHVRALAPRAPAALAAICERCLARDPARRYADAGALAADVERFIAGGLVEAHEYSLLERAARALERHAPRIRRASLALLLLSALGVQGLCWWRFGLREPTEEIAASTREAVSNRAFRARILGAVGAPREPGNAARLVAAALHGCTGHAGGGCEIEALESLEGATLAWLDDPAQAARLAAISSSPEVERLRAAARHAEYQSWGVVIFPRGGYHADRIPILRFVLLRTLGLAMLAEAERLEAAGRPDEAEAWMKDVIRVGAHLDGEILIGNVVGSGMRLDAARRLERLFAARGDVDAARAWERFAAEEQARTDAVRSVFRRTNAYSRAALEALRTDADVPVGLRIEALSYLNLRLNLSTPWRLVFGASEGERAALFDEDTGEPMIELAKLIVGLENDRAFFSRVGYLLTASYL